MACSAPLYGFRMKAIDKSTGELIHVRQKDFSERCFTDTSLGFHPDYLKRDERFQFVSKSQFPDVIEREAYWQRIKNTPGYETQLIPCGKCIECRLEYSRQWANRCMLEASLHTYNWFLTLTYDDEHLPMNSKGYPTLRKDRLKKFMKDLRSYFKYHYNCDDIRFFGCGEYGGKTGRPHFHIILFNLPIMDVQFLFTKRGFSYFESNDLDKLWPEGFAVLTDVSWDTCAYVARYVVKKTKNELANQYDELGIEREFVNMSRMPGIAREYYEQHKDTLYKYDKVSIPGVGQVRPSRYFDKRLDFDDPVLLDQVKEKRIQLAEASNDLALLNTTLSPLEYMEVKHAALVKKIESLKRDEI